ncbi:hypothetical protein PQQ73_14495 [Paraburkholderia strydomiana]|uniref:Uncharacterized protein n=1 Tax=Paraburkholderia strydomiana TaxID=1245417 RepID=A0ABW9EEH2_9BURK
MKIEGLWERHHACANRRWKVIASRALFDRIDWMGNWVELGEWLHRDSVFSPSRPHLAGAIDACPAGPVGRSRCMQPSGQEIFRDASRMIVYLIGK